jgi:rubrerythrin
MYEKRKHVLTGLLSKNSKLDRSRKDQINGAISEIETLLKTIDTLRDQEIHENEKLGTRTEMASKTNIFEDVIKKISDKMNVKLEQSQTKHNLVNIFIRKCETRTRYEFFAKLARNEGYEHVAETFMQFAEQENQHAKIVFKQLNLVKKTADNIREAADIENHYHQQLYGQYENTAKQEGFKDIAGLFKELGEIEAEHEKKFLKLLRTFHENKVFRSEHVERWRCRNCGHVSESKEAPKKCIVCKQGQAFFEIMNEK